MRLCNLNAFSASFHSVSNDWDVCIIVELDDPSSSAVSSTCLPQKSNPLITSVSSLSTTYNGTVAISLPSSTERSTVPDILTHMCSKMRVRSLSSKFTYSFICEIDSFYKSLLRLSTERF